MKKVANPLVIVAICSSFPVAVRIPPVSIPNAVAKNDSFMTLNLDLDTIFPPAIEKNRSRIIIRISFIKAID